MAFEAAIRQRQRVVVRQLSPVRATQVSFLRFVHNPAVRVAALVAAQAQDAGLTRYAGHVLALTDTTALDLRRHAGRLDAATVGPIGPGGKGLGLLLHPVLCLAADPDAPQQVLGVSSLQHWHRPPAAAGNKHTRRYQTLPLAQKESHKWLVAGQQTRQLLPAAARITLVGDREGDCYAVLAGLQAQDVDFVFRRQQDRALVDEADRLGAFLARQPAQATYAVTVAAPAATTTHPTRTATLGVRWAPVRLRRPAYLPATEAPAELAVWAVSVTEDTPPAGQAPLSWQLLTTHPVETVEQARQIVGYYARRWWIEQLFRVLKQQGLRVEDTQLADGEAIVRLVALALPAALAVMQLVLSRHSPAPQTLLDADRLSCLRQLAPTLSGRTEKQRNPHPPDSQAWVSWLIARLGGWSGLVSQRPPGVITLKNGWEYFQTYFTGWKAAP